MFCGLSTVGSDVGNDQDRLSRSTSCFGCCDAPRRDHLARCTSLAQSHRTLEFAGSLCDGDDMRSLSSMKVNIIRDTNCHRG